MEDGSLKEYADFLEGHADSPYEELPSPHSQDSLEDYENFLEGHLNPPTEELPVPSNVHEDSMQFYFGLLGDRFTSEELLGKDHAPAPIGDTSCIENVVHEIPDDFSYVHGAVNSASSSSGASGFTWPVVAPGKAIGVTKRKLSTTKTWEAHIWRSDVEIRRRNKRKNGSQYFLGSYFTEEAAKWAHDLAAIFLNIQVSKYGLRYCLNYPYDQYGDFLAQHPGITFEEVMKLMKQIYGKFSRGACELKGVRPKKSESRPGFTATVTRTRGLAKKTCMLLGHFATEEEAGREYDRALLFLEGTDDLGCVISNFPAASYSQAEVDETGRKLSERYPEIIDKLQLNRC